jgi:hypothetical protein
LSSISFAVSPLQVGKLEQDIIFGEANSTEMLAFFTANTNLSPEVKVTTFIFSKPASWNLSSIGWLSDSTPSSCPKLHALEHIETKMASVYTRHPVHLSHDR